MENSYIPKTSQENFCEGLKLCSVRKDTEGKTKIAVKYLSGKTEEIYLDEVINDETYLGKEITRVYSSGHVFINETKEKVFLLTTEKHGKTQHQFTGGSPLEQENKEVIIKKEGKYSFDLEKVRNNAELRTKIRTGVKVLENYNENPLVDWALMEIEENGKIYYKLVCLMHFIVKEFEGKLGFTGKENTVGGEFYEINYLRNIINMNLLEIRKNLGMVQGTFTSFF